MKNFIEGVDFAFVASADQRSRPHLAAARGMKVPDAQHVMFEAWFCHKTLENVAEVPRLAMVVVDRDSGAGYQLTGLVENTATVGLLNGYSPELEEPGMPQAETRILLRVEEILEFSQGPHNDIPIAAES